MPFPAVMIPARPVARPATSPSPRPVPRRRFAPGAPDRLVRCALAWLALASLAIVLAWPGWAVAATPRPVLVVAIDGPVGPASADHVVKTLSRAREAQAAAVVLRLDTPGGLDTSMREIVRAVLASPVPVIAWVGPSGARAASAGTFVLYASHLAAMAPGTNLGAATPVAIGGGPAGGPAGGPGGNPSGGPDGDKAAPGGEAARAPAGASASKALNDAIAYLRSLAELRGRDADWAEAAVREAASLPAEAARRQGVVEIVAGSLDDLLAQAHGRTVRVGDATLALDVRDAPRVAAEPGWRTRLLATLADPNIALLLLAIGFYGLVLEFMHPGALVPGTVGSISLLAGLYGLAALPLDHAGLALLVLGLALTAAEAFVPSFGVLGIGGTAAFVLGATILIDTEAAPGLAVSWRLIAGIAVAGLAFALLVGRLVLRTRRHRVVAGGEAMIGSHGEVLDWRGAHGHVLAHGERWKAESVHALAPGQPVRVVARDGLTLRVEPDERAAHHEARIESAARAERRSP